MSMVAGYFNNSRSDELSTSSADEMDSLNARVSQAVDWVSSQRLLQPQVAIILGSGLGGLADDVQHATALSYEEIPHFRSTHAVGHQGQLLLGFLAGVPVVVMQGRYHRYEGHSSACVSFPVRVMAGLGAKVLIVTNAAGGLNPRYRAGDLMLVDQHIDCLWPRQHAQDTATDAFPLPNTVPPQSLGGSLRQHAEMYDSSLLDQARRIALGLEVNLQRGTYVSTLGPTYETRAEYRMFRWMGGDAVGMSTIPEVLAARQCGLRVLAMSVITNVACTDLAHGTSHAEVVECGKQLEPKLRKLVGQLLEDMAGPAD